MTIGIITIVNVNNYGAELQAFALQHQLSLMGFDAEVINYLYGINPKHNFKGERLTVPIPFGTRVKRKVVSLAERVLDIVYYNKKKERLHNFEDFHKRYNRLSEKIYDSVQSLYDGSLNYDIFCVGSDQVWNYQKGYSLLPFLLDFVPDGVKKIAFASSIGLSSISEDAENIFKQYLSDFDKVTVREIQAAAILTKLLGVDVDVVLDPTLLFDKDEWMKVASYDLCPECVDYLLLYIVTIKPCKYAIRLAESIAGALGLRIVRVFRSSATYDAKPSMINVPEAGPSDFVGLMAKAKFVVTNSFHGTVFAINFQVPFYSVVDSGNKTKSRLQNVLDTFGLSDRLLDTQDEFPMQHMWNVDYTDAVRSLECEREKSIEILRNCIDAQHVSEN